MKKSLILLPFLVFFAGCGEVQFPESVSTPTPSVTPTPQVVVDPNASPNPSVSPLAGTNLSCEAVQKERDNLTEAIKISEIWNSIPVQLAKENKKFKYTDVVKGGRASKFESAIEWLGKAGLVYIANNLKTPKLPLSGYIDKTKFIVDLIKT